ncbi:hypothetical protein C8A05DRAFT_38818 [Staphylotrichum tortipilum]|uniref:Uncharacterized protein n=1 Tax=Staphylotrichum tortipilum TaxID=2831512 RepID=A0AAN6MCU3_9PEZI|nr:hypothetical protein C8A05DRAFT_38818 [Staphylotrichum longicolle]
MPSFTSRHYTPDRFHSLSKDDVTPDALLSPNPSLGRPSKPSSHHSGLYPSSLALVPSDGSLLDYFDLPSPPSTPHRAAHHTHSTLSYSSLSGFPSPASTRLPTPSLCSSRRSSMSSTTSSPASSPPMACPPRWPNASQRIHRLRPRSRSTSSTSSSSSSGTMDVEMTGTDTDTTGLGVGVMTTTAGVLVRPARRTPYYPPNASRNMDRTRVYMNRGPHFVQNWTPMGSLPRHVQLRIEEGMVKFTA